MLQAGSLSKQHPADQGEPPGLGATVPPRHRAGWIAAFAAKQAFNAARFYTWRPLY